MGWGCSAEVGALLGLGKCNSSRQPGVGVEEEARRRGPPGSAVESVGLGRATVRIGGCGERGWRRLPRPQLGRGRGLTCVVPRQPPARPPAIPSKAPEISVPSACGNVVWRKVAQRPRAPAPPPPVPPPPALSPSPSPPSACAPSSPPPRTGRAVAHPPAEQTWSSFAGLLGRNLGRLGVKANIPVSVLEPRSCQGVWIPEGRRKSWPGLESPPPVQGEPAAVSGARIAAWLEAENALGNCPQC